MSAWNSRLQSASSASTTLAAIGQRDVRAWVADRTAHELAPATVVKAYHLLGKVLVGAVDTGMIAQSPCRRVPLSKIEREEMRFLTPVEIARLADTIRPHYRALVLVGAYGGLRIGELAGGKRVGDDVGSCVIASITSQELAANCSLVIRLPGGNLTGQFIAIAGPAPRQIALTGGTGRYRMILQVLSLVARGTGLISIQTLSRISKSRQTA
jgi:hypothetical protein